MEQRNPKIVKNSDSNFHGRGLCDKINSRQSNTMSVDKVWEDQWSLQMESWASLARHGQAMHHLPARACQSPSTSESSFSVSTQDSPSLSAQSEASTIAADYMLQSPDSSQGRFSKINLFSLDVKQAKPLSMENVGGDLTKLDKQMDWMLLQERGIFESIQHGSDLYRSGLERKKLENLIKAKETRVQSPIHVVHKSEGVSDEGWLSDETESWASASSRDLSWSHSCDGADDAPNVSSTSHCNGQGERGRGATDRSAHTTCPVIANRYDDENANIPEKQSNAEVNDEITVSDNENCIPECIPSQVRSDNRSSAPALEPPGSICLTKVQFGMHAVPKPPNARELETTCFDRYKSSALKGHANHLRVNMSCTQRGMNAYSKRIADGLSEGNQELQVQEGAEHQPFACGLLEAENTALQSQEEHGLSVLDSTKIGISACLESTSHTKQAHLKSRYSAAVEDKYSSTFLHGHFRFAEQDGSQCYSFSVHDSDEVFFARACQPESESNTEGRCCLYTFHSRKDQGKTKAGWKSWLKKEKLASSLVGKLKVSNVKHMRTEDGSTEETHYVLYGEDSQLPPENEAYKSDQISGQLDSKLLKQVCSSKSKFSKPTFNSQSKKTKQQDDCKVSMPAATASQGVVGSCLHEATTQMELAAIVITTTVEEYNVTRTKIHESANEDGNGWGIAFLDKGFKRGRRGSGFLGKSLLASEEEPQFIAASAFKDDMVRLQEKTYAKSQSLPNEGLTQKTSCSKCEQPKMAIDMVVILPAGNHGLLRHDASCAIENGDPCGPTSLLECWQSGGCCDCGGWDMGCGLSVLKAATLTLHKTRTAIALTNRDRISWITPENALQIFTQGWKQKKLFVLEIIQTGIFSLSFQARLSPLQAFAAAVAICHEQITHK